MCITTDYRNQLVGIGGGLTSDAQAVTGSPRIRRAIRMSARYVYDALGRRIARQVSQPGVVPSSLIVDTSTMILKSSRREPVPAHYRLSLCTVTTWMSC